MTYVVLVTQTQPEEGDEYRVFRALPDAAKMFKAVDAAAVPDQPKAAYLSEVPG